MEFEILKQSHLKRNIVIGIIIIGIISAVMLTFTRAKYRTTESIPLINGTINYAPYDLKVVAMYQEKNGEYQGIDTVPISGYNLNKEKSYCEVNNMKDNNITIEYQNGAINFLGMTTKGTKCQLYFDESKSLKDIILANSKINEGIPDFNKTAITDEGVYKAEDDWGESYYFRGAVENNWVKFAGFYWRIIRINGNGSIRLIYSGNKESGPVATGKDTQIGTSAFNSKGGDNVYLGYMYSLNQNHGISISSTIKEKIDEWYYNNLRNYAENIDENSGFCGDRSSYINTNGSLSGGGMGTTDTYYGAYIRLITNKKPSLNCPNSSDLYTTNSSIKGNKVLDYPIGLISADEVVMAGGKEGSANNEYYLYTDEDYWTITPQNGGKYNYPFAVHSNGFLGDRGQQNANNGIRPVINIASDVIVKSGNGTISSPYEI